MLPDAASTCGLAIGSAAPLLLPWPAAIRAHNISTPASVLMGDACHSSTAAAIPLSAAIQRRSHYVQHSGCELTSVNFCAHGHHARSGVEWKHVCTKGVQDHLVESCKGLVAPHTRLQSHNALSRQQALPAGLPASHCCLHIALTLIMMCECTFRI